MTSAGPSWRVVQFRPGGRPIESLARALAGDKALFPGGVKQGVPLEAAVQGTLRLSRLGIVDLLRQARLPGDMNVLVVADQFEELFRYRVAGGKPGEPHEPTADGRALVDLLLEAADPRLRLYVVITLRADFLGDCAEFAGLPEAINRGQYLVPRLTRDERRRAITLPAKVLGGRLAPNLITRLMNDADEHPDQLVLLQHALNRTWAAVEPGPGERVLELDHYVEIGGLDDALNRHAESIFDGLGSTGQPICRKLFQALTDKVSDARGTRRPTAFGTLSEIIELPAAPVARVVEPWCRQGVGFLTLAQGEPLQPQTVVDLSHESLMRVWRRLARWADEEADAAAFLAWDVLEAREENLVVSDQIVEQKRRNTELELDARDVADENTRLKAEQLALVRERAELVQRADRLELQNADLVKASDALERENQRSSRRLLEAGYLVPDEGISHGEYAANGLGASEETGWSGRIDRGVGSVDRSAELKRRIAQLEERLRADLAETRRFELLASELAAENARLAQELEVAVNERARLRSELEALRATSQELEQRIVALRTEQEQLEKALDVLRRDRDAAEARLDALEGKHERLRDRGSDLRAHNALLSEFVGRLPRRLRDSPDAGPH